jgi:nicotinamidase-related amidase
MPNQGAINRRYPGGKQPNLNRNNAHDPVLCPEERTQCPPDPAGIGPDLDRSPALPVRQPAQSRAHDDREQRHRARQGGQDFRCPDHLDHRGGRPCGKLIKGLQNVFPEQKPIDRTFINTWEDARVVDAVKNTGRKKLIMAALWSEICLAMPAIQAAGEGYEVYAVTDASGGVSAEAHEMAVRRMVMAGVVPMTWLAVASELQRDWARQDSAKALGEVLADHAGATGTAFAWELQLLGQKAAVGA